MKRRLFLTWAGALGLVGLTAPMTVSAAPANSTSTGSGDLERWLMSTRRRS